MFYCPGIFEVGQLQSEHPVGVLVLYIVACYYYYWILIIIVVFSKPFTIVHVCHIIQPDESDIKQWII